MQGKATNVKTLRQPLFLEQAEFRVYGTGAAWLAGLIALSLAPIPVDQARGLTDMLIVGSGAACLVWLGRHAGPGELKPPSPARTAGFTILVAAATVLFVVARAHGIGGPEVVAGWPFAISLAATVTALVPVLGLRDVPVAVATVLGGLAALATAWLIGERAGPALFCEFAVSGAMVGAAFAFLTQQARALVAETSVEERSPR
jgi:hypothetical protein